MDLKYYTYVEPGENDEPVYHTLSEVEILEQYFPYWNEQMIKKFGANYIQKYNFDDCVQDWCVVHWAWESK